MERTKVKLKKEYKKLVRAGKIEDADKILVKYWKLCGIVKSGMVSKSVKNEDSKKDSKKESKKESKYTKEFLQTLSFKELKVVGLKFGTTDRSKAKLIKEILNLQ